MLSGQQSVETFEGREELEQRIKLDASERLKLESTVNKVSVRVTSVYVTSIYVRHA